MSIRTSLHRFALAIAVLCGTVVLAQTNAARMTPEEVDAVVSRLEAAAGQYVSSSIAGQLQRALRSHRDGYRMIADPAQLAERLTADMRETGRDRHLAVTFGEELGVRKTPTDTERQHAHEFDHANGYGVRSARRLPGNIGYVDIGYFSPDAEAGAALAAAMRVVSGTDALLLDLRQNGGGSGDTARTLASYFFDDVVQFSSIIERVDGSRRERQHWSVPYVEAPRYLNRPVFLLTSRRTHSAAEVLAYDLKNLHRATTVGQPTAGDATAGSGEVSLGFGLTAFVPNGEIESPVTHTNYMHSGVEPDIAVEPAHAMLRAYRAALASTQSRIVSPELTKEKADAMRDPGASLRQEIDGFIEPPR